jgi:chromate transport protein ChrA
MDSADFSGGIPAGCLSGYFSGGICAGGSGSRNFGASAGTAEGGKTMILLQLFWEYFKVGLFAVGGGMATIPFLYDLADKTGWFTHAQLADMLAVSESTPGAIGVNMATYVGYTTAGVPGAVIATLGLTTPSVIVILLVARALRQFRPNRYVEAAFYGLRPTSTAMIASAGVLVMTGKITTTIHGVCDRCASDFDEAVDLPIDVVLVTELANEENEDEWVFPLEGDSADLEDIVRTIFVLNLDSKLLCKPDCKGLCCRCGRNLNIEPCICEKELDPRFAALKQLLEK